ncbi:MAG TPA: peptidoglycan-binding domain-containing protein [Candidatus Paceibacterota bacterium]|nr:peptidoglycan-binding domain-containing protein [Candidatus Paceibacterota bacterium]
MKYILTPALGMVLLGALALATPAFATVPPTLSLSTTGTGDNVRITVTGDPNVSVILSYNEVGSGPQITSLGSTDASGAFSTTVSSAAYGLISGTQVTAILNGTSGPKSPSVAWPTVTSSNALALSQNAIIVNAGSSATLTTMNGGSTALYVSNNSNSSIANVSISGTQITISGNTAGSTTVTLCQVGNTTDCPNVYVTVKPAGTAQLSLSQTNATVVSGQNLPITVTGGTGVYQILNNSNPSIIQASVNGSILTLTTGVATGSSSITVCSSDNALCGIVVATAGSANSVAITFSSAAPIVSVNQNTAVNVYGPSGVQFYVSSNSNPSIVQANLSGTVLTLTGIAAGSSSVAVCASTGTCASLTATVQAAATSASIALSQNTLSVLSGQNSTIAITGGEQPYFMTGGTSSVSQETVAGGTLTVYGVATGTSEVNVCSAGGGCVLLVVTVNGGGTAAAPVSVTVPAQTPTAPTAVAVPVAPAYVFTADLKPGSSGAEVTALQKFLAAQGLLSATPNGYYGPQTKAAVMQFQSAHGVSQLGIVGPATRAALNRIENADAASAGSPDATIATMTLAELKSEVQLLQAELTQALSRITQLTGQ